MSKKTSGKSSTEGGKEKRKLADLAPRRVRGGEAASIKGGAVGHEKWIELNTRS